MYYLNVHIEIISSLILLLSAGLTVDYAAHVSLEFTRCKGTKNGLLKNFIVHLLQKSNLIF